MTKYKEKQLLITNRNLAIISSGEDIIEYYQGEIFEILEVIEIDGEQTSYRIDFGIDNGQIDYTFDEDAINSFSDEEIEEF